MGTVWFVLGADRARVLDTIGDTLSALAVAALGWIALQLLQRSRRGASGPTRQPGEPGEPPPSAADALAGQAAAQYREQLPRRDLGEHRLAPVPWRRLRAPESAAPVPDTGGRDELVALCADERFRRLVVLGGPGSGKSAVALLAAVRSLDERARHDGVGRVPVLLTPHDWEPRRRSARDWLADRLRSDFPDLDGYGFRAAEQLIEQGRLTLFLDGFDDIDAHQRESALRSLDRLNENVRLVLFGGDGRHDPNLPGTVVLELRPVPVEEVVECLDGWEPDDPDQHSWRGLTDHVRQRPDGGLARALDTPFMLSLLRGAFAAGASEDRAALAADLPAAERTGGAEAVRLSLLGQVVPIAYLDRTDDPALYTPEQAERWLRRLAERMTERETRQLAWWQMPEWVPHRWRILAGVAGCAFGAGLIAGLDGLLTNGFAERTVTGVLPAAVVGAVLGLAIAIVTERRATGAARPGGSGGSGFNTGMGMMAGLATLTAVALAVAPVSGPIALAIAAPSATLVAGAGAGFIATPERRLHPPPSTTLARAGRLQRFLGRLTVGLPAGLATGVPAGLASGVPIGLGEGPVGGLVVGLTIGLAYVVAFGLIDGYAQLRPDDDSPVGPRGVWRRDRRRGLATGVVFGLAIGLAAGLTDALAMARHEVPWVAVRVGLITGPLFAVVTGTAAGLTVSNVWRTMVGFVQLWAQGVVPLRAMRFLEDAYQRQVLRVAGPYYEFRHARLREFLATPSAASTPAPAPAPAPPPP